jgi:hypothetical protein
MVYGPLVADRLIAEALRALPEPERRRCLRKYAEVGTINGGHKGGTMSGVSNADVMKRGREGAGEQGCDAIIITDETDNFATAGDAVVNQKGYEATCIVWIDG